jgi:hypothetical protein
VIAVTTGWKPIEKVSIAIEEAAGPIEERTRFYDPGLYNPADRCGQNFYGPIKKARP